MNIHMRGLLVVALAFGLAACGTAKGNDLTDAQPTVASPTTTYSGDPYMNPSDSPETLGSETVEPFAPEPTLGNPTFDFSQLDGDIPKPTKRLLAGSTGTPVNGTGYAVSAFKSNRSFWEQYFNNDQLEMPRLVLDLVSPGDSVTTPCHTGRIGSTYRAIVICAEGQDKNLQTNHLIVPMELFAQQRAGTRRAGDLAMAIAVSRTVSFPVATAMGDNLNVPAPNPMDLAYVGACLSGVWAYATYPAGTFTDNEVRTALTQTGRLHFELPGQSGVVEVAPNADTVRDAWMSGYAGGNVMSCAVNFWKRGS